MIYNVYCMKDEKVEFSPNLVCNIEDERAINDFALAMYHFHDKMFAHPEDYSLYHVGTFDTSNGSFISCEPRFLMHGLHAFDRAKQYMKNRKSEEIKNDRNMETETSRT